MLHAHISFFLFEIVNECHTSAYSISAKLFNLFGIPAKVFVKVNGMIRCLFFGLKKFTFAHDCREICWANILPFHVESSVWKKCRCYNENNNGNDAQTFTPIAFCYNLHSVSL